MSDEPKGEDLVKRLAGRGVIDDEDLARIVEFERASEPDSTPWFLHPFLFLGAFTAGAMITVGVAELLDLHFKGTTLAAAGAFYIGFAVLLHRRGRQLFSEYLGLSCSLGGHGFLLLGLADIVPREAREWFVLLAATGLCAGLYGVYRSYLHRFLSVLLVFVVAKFAFPSMELADALHVVVAVAAALCCGLFARSRQVPAWRPLGHACAFGLMVLLLPLSERGLWFDDVELPHRLISSATMSIALLWAMHVASRDETVETHHRLLAVLLVAGVAAMATPGIPAALFLIVLGHASQHHFVAFVGLAGLPVFVWKYYYALNQDLLAKSAILVGSGLLLLLARTLVLKLFTNESPARGMTR